MLKICRIYAEHVPYMSLLTLACADARDDLQFIQDFKTTMIQLLAFFPKKLKIYVKTTMQIKESENLPKTQRKELD